MDFAGINYLAVVVAAVVSFFVGWPWYMTFGKTWARAVGLDPDNPPGPKPTPFIVLGIALLVMAYVLAGLIGHLGSGQVTIRNGIISGLFVVWIGFVVTTDGGQLHLPGPQARAHPDRWRPFSAWC